MIGLIGKKIGMTQIFDESGKVIPVTVIQAGPCKVICRRTIADNGYEAIQVGYEEIPEKKVSKPMLGHFKKHGSPNFRHVKEFRPNYGQLFEDYKTGDELKADLFGKGETVSVSAKSKGCGFTGVMKRHGFAGFIATHGSHESFRGGGSIGQCAQPSRVFKGTKMAGQHGNTNNTTRHLIVAKVDTERNLVMVKGAVPGHRNSLVIIHKER
ncbi:MAG: 50S ribosomal protein L3 [Candidatus Cloacimonetes bacterium]|jgi:large subunit ribosomal protein L3|nr:50S ribosomal protein L3 [Candidatus Cloacimonadota bacterium]MCB5287343.1 50S ribosomal protein L3 [Candidatus Cloacimonadota bacterium]MCK9185060.1 50S ribosomal protein L3 [Candidatus Cloacimonadota bacterium]MCK9583894.1 50S ribosomal protein L3 [Candidatus Cloacimonadota bacterium]MDY0229665.1 50S ribosomal protein L3 [Candidatus Cloacimonadaceae bacterium]